MHTIMLMPVPWLNVKGSLLKSGVEICTMHRLMDSSATTAQHFVCPPEHSFSFDFKSDTLRYCNGYKFQSDVEKKD